MRYMLTETDHYLEFITHTYLQFSVMYFIPVDSRTGRSELMYIPMYTSVGDSAPCSAHDMVAATGLPSSFCHMVP